MFAYLLYNQLIHSFYRYCNKKVLPAVGGRSQASRGQPRYFEGIGIADTYIFEE